MIDKIPVIMIKDNIKIIFCSLCHLQRGKVWWSLINYYHYVSQQNVNGFKTSEITESLFLMFIWVSLPAKLKKPLAASPASLFRIRLNAISLHKSHLTIQYGGLWLFSGAACCYLWSVDFSLTLSCVQSHICSVTYPICSLILSLSSIFIVSWSYIPSCLIQ